VAAIAAEMAIGAEAVRAEVGKFRDHYRALGSRRVRWESQFANWCRRIPQFGAAPARPPPPAALPQPPATDEDPRWTRVKARLAERLGPDVVTAWFARMAFSGIEDRETVRLTAPTRFLRDRCAAHYAPQLIAAWHGEDAAIARVEIAWADKPAARPRAPPLPQLPLLAAGLVAAAQTEQQSTKSSPARIPQAEPAKRRSTK
jgi:hypothetical protein